MRKSFVIESTASVENISRSPLNRSSSKNLWTFAKSNRFPRNQSYCDSFYKSPSSLLKRPVGIGYGTKSDFTKVLALSPGAKYELKTIFDMNKNLKRGYSMNLRREKLPHQSYIELEPLRNPSPNHYNNLKLDKGIQYSIRKKTKNIDKTISIEAQNDTPGPGRYENPESLSPKGQYCISKYPGTGAARFNPRRSKRFFEFPNMNPGPGNYNEVNKLSNTGYYPLSQTHGEGKRFFDHERRIMAVEKAARKNENPGPGSYRSTSEFGQYDGEVYQYTHAECFGYPGRNKSRVTDSTNKTSRKKVGFQ